MAKKLDAFNRAFSKRPYIALQSEYLYVGGREDAIKELDNLCDFRLIRTKIDNSDDKMYYGESKRSHFGM